MASTDKDCVERCRNGHPEEFGHLVDLFQNPLFCFLAPRVGDTRRAQEAAQGSLVRAFLSLGSLRKPDSFCSRLLGIADRVAKEGRRSEAGRRRESNEVGRLPASPPRGDEPYPLEEALAALPEAPPTDLRPRIRWLSALPWTGGAYFIKGFSNRVSASPSLPPAWPWR